MEITKVTLPHLFHDNRVNWHTDSWQKSITGIHSNLCQYDHHFINLSTHHKPLHLHYLHVDYTYKQGISTVLLANTSSTSWFYKSINLYSKICRKPAVCHSRRQE